MIPSCWLTFRCFADNYTSTRIAAQNLDHESTGQPAGSAELSPHPRYDCHAEQLQICSTTAQFASASSQAALTIRNFEQVHQHFKVQKIITEMLSSLKHDAFPELCHKLAALYQYVYKKLIEANVEHKIESLKRRSNC